MWRHGLLFRLGFLTNSRLLTAIVKPRFIRTHKNSLDIVLQNRLTGFARSFCKISDVNTYESESVNLRSDATIGKTVTSQILGSSNSENDDQSSYRGKRWTNEQEEILYTEIERGQILSSDEWSNLRERVYLAGKIINEGNIDVTILGLCITFKQLNTGRSYLSYLKEAGQELNIASVSKFFRLCFACSDEVDTEVQQLICELYDTLRAKYTVFDASTAESAIQGLAITSRWREGLELLNEIKLSSSPKAYTYSALAKAAFDNDESELGWQFIATMLEDNKRPLVFAYEAWLKYAERFSAGDKKVEEGLVTKLLQFFSTNDIRLTEDTVKMIRLWFEYSAPHEANWNAEFTTVDPRGMCKSCHQYLRPIALNVQEFETLRSAFMVKAVVGSNVFLKTTPEELSRFQQFVKDTAPYDVVVDGLNVSYSAGAAGKGNPRSYSRMLQSVVAHLVNQDKKVLVLGRQHMNTWPRNNMSYIRDNAHVFLAEDLSQDDPFLLYAAMYSGLGTCFISRDLMRSHAFVLREPRLQRLFLRWQKQHQYQVLYIGEGGNVKMKFPVKFDTGTQQTRYGGWHVPYDLDNITPRAQALNVPFQWLCLNQYSEKDDNERPDQRERSFEYRSSASNSRQVNSNRDVEDFNSSYPRENGSFRRNNFQNRNFVNRREVNDGLSRESVESQRKPQQKWYDDSDDEDVLQPRVRSDVRGRGRKEAEAHMKMEEWSDDESDEDYTTRPSTSRRPPRKQAAKTIVE